MATKSRAYALLGGLELEEELKQEEKQQLEAQEPPSPPEELTVDTAAPDEYPEDVWEGASIAADRGAMILKAYIELTEQR